MVTFLCWLPFILTVLIFGTVSLILGYKRGYIRAAISVLATAISAIAALLVSKLIASAVAGKLGGLISDIADFGGILSGNALRAVTAALTAIALFGPVFVIVSAMIKNVCSAVNGKYIKKPTKSGEKLGGLAISVVDTLLFAILLTLPVYSTLATVSPVAEAVSAFAEKDKKDEPSAMRASPVVYGSFCSSSAVRIGTGEIVLPISEADGDPASADASEVAELLKKVFNIPLCRIADAKPFRALYDSLGTANFDGEKTCITKSVRDVGNVGREIADALNNGIGDNTENELAIIDGLDELFKDSRFVRAVACEMLKNTDSDGKFGDVIKNYADNVTEDTVADDISAVCDILRSAVNNGVVKEIIDNKDNISAIFREDSALAGEFIYDLTAALNSTKNLAGIKSDLISTAAGYAGLDDEGQAALYDVLSKITPDPLSAEDAVKEGDSFKLIICSLGHLTSAEDNISELALGVGELIEGIARHPAIDTDTVEKFVDSFVSSLNIGGFGSDSPIIDTIKASIPESIEKPVGEGSVGGLTKALGNLAEAISLVSENNDGSRKFEMLLTEDKNALKSLAEVITPDVIAPFGLDDRPGACKVTANLIYAMSAAELSGAEIRSEAKSISDVMGSVISTLSSKSISESGVTDMINKAKASSIVTDTIGMTVTENGKRVSDPLKIGMSKSEKNTVKTALSNYLKNNGDDASKQLIANLALFFGVKK